MASRGDFSPITNGDVNAATFSTDQGKIIYNFCMNYVTTTGGAARWPSLTVLKSRFSQAGFDLPKPSKGDTVPGLAHELLALVARREIAVVASDLTRIAAMPDFADHLAEQVARLRGVLDTQMKSKRITAVEGILKILDDYDSGNLLPSGLPWPWPTLQQATRGQQKKEIYFFAARPKQKKTFIALKVAAFNAFVNKADGIIFTPEMPAVVMLLRTVAHGAGIPYKLLKHGELSPEDYEKLVDLAHSMGAFDEPEHGVATLRARGGGTITILESAGRGPAWMQAQMAMLRPRWAVLDSLYLQKPDGASANISGWEKVTLLSRAMKQILMEEEVTGIATHQLNKFAAKNVAGLEDMAFADALAQDADIVMQAISGKLEGKPMTALRVLGGREIDLEGLLINSECCTDFSEAGRILDMGTVKKLMALEEKAMTRTQSMLDRAKKKKVQPS